MLFKNEFRFDMDSIPDVVIQNITLVLVYPLNEHIYTHIYALYIPPLDI